ncbi:MAG: putative phosphate transporter [Acidobacteria bacterium]|jgi:PiT family inorganic phosphate transporter|nr:putative phosphate transporter [Acidobacteriota bacterium]
MESQLIVVIFVIVVALAFDFLNGFHDAANSIATVVSTHVLSPRAAVLLAAVCNFLAAVLLETKVAATIGKDIVHQQFLDPYMVMCGLMGAIVWDLITWWWGLPTSSSHALVGGFAGAAIAKAGFIAIKPEGFLKIVPYIVIAPIVGFVLGRLMMHLMIMIFDKSSPRKVDHIFRRGQLISASIFSFSHGMNDAQKTMGIILALLVSANLAPRSASGAFQVPLWVIISCHTAIALGTYFGGWRIVKTLGMRLTKLQPVSGFCAETGGGVTIVFLSLLGIPLSTTHTITGAIVGAGSIRRWSAVRWKITSKIVWAWVLTIPCSAFFGALFEFVILRFIRR